MATGTLFVVGTPIGNLGDVTVRQLETLQSADFIAAEDTRVTRKLLTHFDLHKPLVSYHDHSGRHVAEGLVERLLAGESCAVVTDAGMPCISDPGEELVKLCHEAGIPIRVVPGPSAAVSALAISGQPTGRFAFEGFLSVNRKQRTAHLDSVRHDPRTLIFYEAPHKLLTTLRDLYDALGDRPLSLCRELTKIYEEVRRCTLSEAVAYYEANPPKGEFVLVIAGAAPEDVPALTLEDAVARAAALVDGGLRAADACRTVAKDTGFSKSELYAALLSRP